MAIIQDKFYVPDDMMIKILTGELKRFGGVVRYAQGPNRGQIVKHLKPIDSLTENKAKALGEKALQFAAKNKNTLIITGAVVGVVGLGTGIYYIVKKHENLAVKEFRASLKVYLDSIREGKLDMHKINALMNSLVKLKNHKDYMKISIQLSAEELDVLVNRIYEYTIKLAKDNSVALTEEEQIVEQKNDAILNLQRYLEMQKKIFEAAA